MALLTINLDGVAAQREFRGKRQPDPAQAAVLAELAGVDGVAIQLRRDRRYVRDRDLYVLREVVKSKLVIEIPPTEELISRTLDVKPAMVTFLADHPDADVPPSGIDFGAAPVDFSDITARFRGVGIPICFLIEPLPDAVRGAVKAGADGVLINCAGFTEATTIEEAQGELDRIDATAQVASKANLTVMAGRGVNAKNVVAMHELGLIDEYVIGQSLIARAMLVGIDAAVKELLALVRSDRSQG
ncbi:pyridoxine 5'-phosphate synthase [candidate division GN15 bacterium]|nr:pyridoxine 5'-phosphate synthase [candidate division GN15 bacterium]